MKIRCRVQLIAENYDVEMDFVIPHMKIVKLAQMIVESVNPIVVITFAKNGKIARRAPAIVVLALIRPSVGMRHVTARKPVHRVLRIAATVLHQGLYAVILYAKAQTEKIVDLAPVIAVNASHTVVMGHVNTITMRTASYAQKTVDRALLHRIQSVGMETVIQMKIVLLVLATVQALVPFHPVLMEKCAMIQMFV